jgi:enamine deaminase RidA (YjgF/YER057c/UK114 family)
MRLLATLIAAAAAVVMILTNPTFAATPLKRIASADGDTVAVVVPANATVDYSRQYFDADPANLLTELATPPGQAVKLNVVAATPAAAEAAREAIRKHFPASARPAVSVVVGAMPRPDVTVGIDAVAIASSGGAGGADGAGISPPGARIFISGQAELIAKSPAEATAKTLEGLQETLAFLGCKPADVVQAKCFLTPMSAMPQVLREFERALPELDHRIVFVEWKSNLPIEIELIVHSPTPPPADAPAVEYLTPPGKTASPLFARVVRVNRGDLIYIGDIASAKPASGAEQVTSIFERLQEILKQTDSDLRHLVKATYYVSDDDASKQLNVIRPTFYDPKRPPAASKAMVPAVGVAGRSITIDMIAIPTTQPAKP